MICFNFDGTLTSRNTFLQLLIDAGGWQSMALNMLKESPALLLYALGMKNKGRMKEQLFGRFFEWWAEEKFTSLCEFSAKKNKHLLRPDMMQLMDNAIGKGEQVVVVTSNFEPLVREYLKDYPQVQIISTTLDIYQGRLSGRFKSPLCAGMEKVRRLLELFPDKRTYNLTVYGNAKEDVELLDLADEGHYSPL